METFLLKSFGYFTHHMLLSFAILFSTETQLKLKIKNIDVPSSGQAVLSIMWLLGLEVAGPLVGYGGIHVVSNASTLMVRYIFLIPSSVTTVPVAANVAPAMLSVYKSLQAGAL
jgi:hypothetical protein